MTTPIDQHAREEMIAHVCTELAREFEGTFSPETVQRFVRDSFESLSGARVQVVGAADVVITMGCGDACPVFPGKKYLDWELQDPAGKPVEEVRRIRDEIDRRVHDLLDELVSATL